MESNYLKNKYAEMFGDWLIVLSGANQFLQVCDNQENSKEPIVEPDDHIVPVGMVYK